VVTDDLSDFLPSARKAAGGSTLFWRLACDIAWGLLLMILLFAVPRVEVIFQDFGIPLPRVTSLVIRASHLVRIYLVVAVAPLFVVLLGADWLIRDALFPPSEAGMSRTWSVLMLAVPLLLIAVVLMALGLPLLTIDVSPLSG
jgi:type II secretory pathway component PulF